MKPPATRSLSDLVNERGDGYEVPDGYGLMMRLSGEDGSVSIEGVEDQHYAEIHPNCYAPLSLSDVRLLHGGGSGTAVFHGLHPELGSIVMKHGNAKDTNEVFSLASNCKELLERSHLLSKESAIAMQRRLPEFVMVYLSPFHLRDRGAELWASLRGNFWSKQEAKFSSPPDAERRSVASDSNRHLHQMHRESIELISPRKKLETGHGMRAIHIRKTAGDHVEVIVCLKNVTICIPERFFASDNESEIENGVEFLQQLEEQLVQCQTDHNWKVTLAQKTIGGPNPCNGADVLTSGRLVGDLRTELVDNFLKVMMDLSALTWPEERPALDMVRREVENLRKTRDVTTVSKTANDFAGSAILKNFHPVKGRFAELRAAGEKFRLEVFQLAEEEKFPGFFLGQLLKRGSQLSSVFIDPSTEINALDRVESSWMPILEQAVSSDSSLATDCIWTCGLSDAGLHNSFLSQGRGLELFDIGEASLLPKPAFLTKFLMSFFHTAGMEEDGTSWTRRFFIVDEKLKLTPRTKELIPYLESTFLEVMDRLIEEIFEGDKNVRGLLVKYVVLQILSDCAFCFGRWEQKGGGTERFGDVRPLEKWLWRCLWDYYIACHVYSKFLDEP